jgi:hypothetical protein
MLVRNQPETITNAMINEIGKKYLSTNPEPNWLHDNHGVAKELAEYKSESDSKDKWIFLADKLMTLHQSHKFGQLSKGIIDLLSEAFPALRTHFCSSCPSVQIKQTLYDPINRYYNDKMYRMVRELHAANFLQTNPALAAIISSTSALITTPNAPVYPALNQSEDNSQDREMKQMFSKA